MEVPLIAAEIAVAKLIARDPSVLERLTRMTAQAQTGDGLAELAKEAREVKV